MEKFDDIRPYWNSEVKGVINELLNEKEFVGLMLKILPEIPLEQMIAIFKSVEDRADLIKKITNPMIEKIRKSSTTSLDVANIEYTKEPCLIVSNHRDIVLDTTFMNKFLFDNGQEITETAIGDNLFVYPWIKKVVRLNKSFVVKRGLTMREMMTAFMHMSEYIRWTITERNESIWIAQREGRSKNSDDQTQSSILKMFAMSGKDNFFDNLKPLNIIPLTISYEYDPCDYLKAREFQLKRDDAGYTKTPQDDLLSMQTGIVGFKGRVNYVFSPSIKSALESLELLNIPKAEQADAVAKVIDSQIHKNYVIYPINKIAYDLYLNTSKYTKQCRAEEVEAVNNYFEQQLAKIELPNKDNEFLRQRLLEMYAKPLINFEK